MSLWFYPSVGFALQKIFDTLLTMTCQIKMAEEMVKRITGLNPMFNGMSEISSISMPPFDGSPSDTSTDAAVPVQDDPNNYFCQSSNPPMSSHEPKSNNGLAEKPPVENVQQNSTGAGSKMGRTASMQRVASLEHLQKRIRAGGNACGAQASAEQ